MIRKYPKLISIFSLVLALLIIITQDINSKIYANYLYANDESIAESIDLLSSTLKKDIINYESYKTTHNEKLGTDELSVGPLDHHTNEKIELTYGNKINYEINIKSAGYYNLEILYSTDETSLNNGSLRLQINDEVPFREAKALDIPLYWKDKSKEFDLDSYGDEALPNQIRIGEEKVLRLYDNTYKTTFPLEFYFSSGKHKITLENISGTVVKLGELKIRPITNLIDYDSYRSNINSSEAPEGFIADIDATQYIEKNSSYVRLASIKNPDVSPYDAVYKKLNIIDEAGWNRAGQSITYKFSVPETADYALSFHYINNKDDFSVFRSIVIDDEIPFVELNEYEFPFTNGKWKNITLSDKEGNPYLINLSKGEHAITFTASQGNIGSALNKLQLLIDHINQFALEIRKITGKDIDKNRTWKLTNYLPETVDYLKSYENLIEHIMLDMAKYAPNGVNSSTLSFLNKAKVKIIKMQEKPDDLPLYFEDLYSGTGSVTQMLGDTIDRLNNSGLGLDAFYIHAVDKALPAEQAGFLAKLNGMLRSFISTFVDDKYVVRPDEDAVNVWVSRPITYVDIMQKMLDSDFTPKTGIKVKLSVMPDMNRLILSNAAGKVPDVALGLPSYMPYDIAIRGAAYPLTNFSDFWQVAKQSTPGAFIPYIFNDEVFGFPETLDFQALIYRKDVFDTLDIKVPDNWNDVLSILPTLQRYGMNFYHSASGGVATKWFYQTSPLIYQNGGTLYEDDGYYAAIDEAAAVKGITQLTKLFTTYSLPIQTPNFYNSFRYNQLPIGMVDFNTYLQILNAAPELKGQWELANYPGVVDENGETQRWFIGNGTSAVLLDKGKQPNEAWEFLKWWTSKNTQTEYANLLSSTYGPEYVWLSSNLEAASNAPIPLQDKQIILEQIPWLRDVPRTPGQYMLERGLSDVWSQAVQDGVMPRVAIDRQLILINREIRKKMLEFGFIDQNGHQLKPYVVRDIDWIEEQFAKHGESE